MILRHQVLLGAILLGNAVAFAGVDKAAVLVTTILALALVLDMRRLPAVPPLFRVAGVALLAVGVLHLVPLPNALRRLLQPGFADLMHAGWAPLSLAPWATVQVLATGLVALAVALGAARMAATRSGLPTLLWLLATTGIVLALTGLVGETGAPDRVLLVRANTGGGSVYGPYVNSNHFAQGIELSLPAIVVLLAASLRHLGQGGGGRKEAIVATAFGTLVAAGLAIATLVRSGSRGGVLFMVVAAVATLPLWRGPRSLDRRAVALVLAAAVVAGVGIAVASTAVVDLREEFQRLLAVEGLEGNTRWELWAGTVRSWQRAPVLGSGIGSYSHVIGIDKPATGRSRLGDAHNDWLEWGSTAGVVGAAALAVAVVAVLLELRRRRLSGLRFELRYPMAGAGLALLATALHETVGFGLKTPLNLYLAACWIGLLWGISSRSARPAGGPPQAAGEAAPDSTTAPSPEGR